MRAIAQVCGESCTGGHRIGDGFAQFLNQGFVRVECFGQPGAQRVSGRNNAQILADAVLVGDSWSRLGAELPGVVDFAVARG